MMPTKEDDPSNSNMRESKFLPQQTSSSWRSEPEILKVYCRCPVSEGLSQKQECPKVRSLFGEKCAG